MYQIIKFGSKSLDYLNEYLRDLKPKSIFLLTGKKSFYDSGAKNKISYILKKYNYYRFSDFEKNPKIEDVEKALSYFRNYKCDLIIAIGGGSVIDIAKLINFFNKKNKPYTSYFKYSFKKKDKIPLVAIPTTAGAGSEATHFAVVYVNKIKFSIANSNLLPDISLIDHNLLKSQNKYQIIVSGLDAFCQGIESFWSVNSNIESEVYSTKAIKYSWNYLNKAVNGDNVFNFLSKSAFFSGKAINITKTTGPHAFSYGFTSNFNIPHGHSVSLFLPFFISFHKKVTLNTCNDKRGPFFVINQLKKISNILGVEYDNLENEILNFLKSLEIEINFKKLGINQSKFINTLKNINQERLNNNPMLLSNLDLRDIYNFNSKY